MLVFSYMSPTSWLQWWQGKAPLASHKRWLKEAQHSHTNLCVHTDPYFLSPLTISLSLWRIMSRAVLIPQYSSKPTPSLLHGWFWNRQTELEQLPIEAWKCCEWAISDIEVCSKNSCVWTDWDHYGWWVEDGGRGREKSNNSLHFSPWLSLSSDREWYSDIVYIIIYSGGILIGPVR